VSTVAAITGDTYPVAGVTRGASHEATKVGDEVVVDTTT